MAGPLGLPLGTFSALLVIAASVAIAVIYASAGGRPRRKGDGDE